MSKPANKYVNIEWATYKLHFKSLILLIAFGKANII